MHSVFPDDLSLGPADTVLPRRADISAAVTSSQAVGSCRGAAATAAAGAVDGDGSGGPSEGPEQAARTSEDSMATRGRKVGFMTVNIIAVSVAVLKDASRTPKLSGPALPWDQQE